jgi:hypothetical protein
LIADAGGGGAVRPPLNAPTITPASSSSSPSTSTDSDAAARARQLQQQIEQMLERLREAQRQAEEARQKAIEAQKQAEQAKQAAEAAKAKADQTKAAADQAAAAKAQQDAKLQDANLRSASADADLKEKDVDLLRAQVAQKREQGKAPDGQASAAADKKVSDAQAARDAAARTSDLSKLYADAQDKESKAQDAEAKVASLTPTPGRPSETVTAAEWQALDDAKTEAATLRSQAGEAEASFKKAAGADATTLFYGTTPAAGGTAAAPPPGDASAVSPAAGADPLHSPLQQLLQPIDGPSVPASPFSTYGLFGTTTPAQSASSALSQLTQIGSGPSAVPDASPFLTGLSKPGSQQQLAQALSGIADGKSVAQAAGEQHMSVDQMLAQARGAGVTIQTAPPGPAGGDVQVVTLHRGGVTLTYTHDLKQGRVSVKDAYTDATAPGGGRTVEVTQDAKGVFSQAVKDPATGQQVTHSVDPATGTRTDTVVAADGTRTETTTALTGAPVLHAVQPGEGYRDVAKAAGLTPAQLLALNPGVDYGVPLKPGQEMVVVGVPTTVKTFSPDNTRLESTVSADGTRQVVSFTASGHRTVLMGTDDPKSGPAASILKSLFDDKKSVAQTAADLGMTQDQVLAALPARNVDVTPASAETNGIQTRTIYDPDTNRVVVETDDPRHDRTVLKVIGDDQVFKVHQVDPDSGKDIVQEVPGAAGYAQQQADQKAALAGDYGQQLSGLDSTIHLTKRMGEPVGDLQAQRDKLAQQLQAARTDAQLAQGKATSVLTQCQQVVVDKQAAAAYQNLVYARPGSLDQVAAAQWLADRLALSDKVDRLSASAGSNLGLLQAGADKQQKQDAATAAENHLQDEFEKWKNDVWMWEGVDKKTADRMKAEGERPTTRIFQDAQQEHDAAWEAFVDLQKDLDKYGDKDLPPEEQPARDAWVQRNQASDAALASDVRFDDASNASTTANNNVLQGDLARLQQQKTDWMLAHPDDFSETFAGQDQMDQLSAGLAQGQIDVLTTGQDKSYTQYLQTMSAADRADPDALKKAHGELDKDNRDAIAGVDKQIRDISKAAIIAKSKAADDYLAQWAQRNPELKKQLDALGPADQPDTRGGMHHLAMRDQLLSGSEQGQEYQAAESMHDAIFTQLKSTADDDVASIKKDDDGVQKDIDNHSFVRDGWDWLTGGGDASDNAKDYTGAELAKATQMRDDLSSGKLSIADYANQENGFIDSYDQESGRLLQKMQDSDATWSVVDEAVRSTVIAAAGIGATIASGGNVAVGFAAAMGASELWDTAGDAYEFSNGQDVNADGHTSMFTLGAKAATGHATWDDVKFTLKDEAIDVATNAVTVTGAGAGVRTAATVGAELVAKDSITVGGRTLLNVGLQEGSDTSLTWGGRAIVGARAGLSSQAVTGAGRVGVETLHVGLDGKLGTEEGDARIGDTFISSAAGLLTAPVTGGLSGALPAQAAVPGVAFGLQFANDAAGTLGTGELTSLATKGQSMDTGDIVAASLGAVPGTMRNLMMYPDSPIVVAMGKPASPTVDNAGSTLPSTGFGLDDAPAYTDLVAQFKGTPPSEIHDFYSDMEATGVNCQKLIGDAVAKYGLTPDEAHAVFGYTTKLFYRDLNNSLEAGGNPDAVALSDLINSGLDKMPESGTTQYRGWRLGTPADEAAFDAKFALGNNVTSGGYWSTGPSEADAYVADRNVVMTTEPGTAREISDLAFGVNFHALIGKPVYSTETIVPPGVTFKVVDIDSKGRLVLEQQ